MDIRLIFLDLVASDERDVTLRGTPGGETCAVQAGREHAVSPVCVDREASARSRRKPTPSGGHLCRRERHAREPDQPVPQTDTGGQGE